MASVALVAGLIGTSLSDEVGQEPVADPPAVGVVGGVGLAQHLLLPPGAHPLAEGDADEAVSSIPDSDASRLLLSKLELPFWSATGTDWVRRVAMRSEST